MREVLMPRAPIPRYGGVAGQFWRWLMLGVEPVGDPRLRIKIISLNLGALSCAVLSSCIAIMFVLVGKWGMIRTSLSQLPIVWWIPLVLWLNHRRHYRWARVVFMGGLSVYLSVFILAGQGVIIYTHYYFLLGAVLCFVLIPLDEWPDMLACMALALGLFYFFEMHGWPSHPDFYAMPPGWLFAVRALVVGSCSILVVYTILVNEVATEVYIGLLQSTALRDALTGLPNRHAGMLHLAEEWSVHQRSGAPMVVGVVDIDHFKRVNDTLGHDRGDQVLQHVAGLIRQRLRAGDYLARMGGEEFLVVWSHTDLTEAQALAEQLRADVQDTPHQWASVQSGHARQHPLTVSIGLAASVPGDNAMPLLHRADMALYRAKGHGRNRVELAPAPDADARDTPVAPPPHPADRTANWARTGPSSA